MICYLLGFFFPAVRPCWGHSPGHQYVVREYDQHCAEGIPFHDSLSCVCCRTQAPCLFTFTFHCKGDSHLEPWVVRNVRLGKRERRFLNFIAWALLGGGIGASVRSLGYSGCLAMAGIPTTARSSWDHVGRKGKAQSASAWVDGQSLLTRQLSCFAWRTLLALGICCCSIFVLITGVKGNQGLFGFGFFFLIGEIQIKLNKWTPDVGCILEGLKKGKRPQREWTWFMGTLYRARDQSTWDL